MLMHYEGCYRGSHWAFFGVENPDLFEHEEVLSCLGPLAGALMRGLCLHGLEPEFACYRQGEEVRFSYILDNTGSRDLRIVVQLEMAAMESDAAPIFLETREERLGPGCWKKCECTCGLGAFASDL